MVTCYRHPTRETGVSCSSCGRPICPDCMTPTSVGMRCPECSKDRTAVRTIRSLHADPVVTYALIAINVLAYLGSSAGGIGLTGGGGGATAFGRGLLFGPAIAEGHEYWRLVTSGFLHFGLGHLFFNMLFLYFLGPQLEAAIGRLNFGLLYGASLLAGAFGALLFEPLGHTAGASGACFGVLGASIVIARDRGIDLRTSGLGVILLINLAFSLTFRNISLGGHVGGFVGGVIAGLVIVSLAEHRRQRALAIAGCVAVGVASVAGAIAVAGSSGLTPNGISLF